MDIANLIKTIEPIYQQNFVIIPFLASFIEITPFGWMIPGGYILAIGGFFAYGNPFGLLQIIVSGAIGGWLVFVIAYLLGQKTGTVLVKKFKAQKSAEYAKGLLERHGASILTTSLMSPPVRFWVAYIAGSQSYHPIKFFVYSFLASFGWTTMWVMLGFVGGTQRHAIEDNIAKFGLIGWAFVLISIALVGYFIKKDYNETKKNK